MRQLIVRSLWFRLLTDEAGNEAVESVLIIGLIAVVVVLASGNVGHKLLLRWHAIEASL